MSNAVDLTIGVDTAVDVSGFSAVDRAAADASQAVAALGNDAADSARKIGVSADAADELAGKAGKTTGALGALSSGFELVGLEQYAGGLQAAAMATDFVSGAGDALNLVMESTAVKTLASKAAMVGSTIATGAQTAATVVMTGAQAALNAVMSANPIALVVIAAVALVAGLVLLYKKSETFRAIIATVGKVGKQAIGFVTNGVQDLVGWAGDKLPGAFNTAKTLVVGYLALMTLPIRTVLTVVKNVVGWVKDDLPEAFDKALTKAQEIGDGLLAPFRAVRDLIQEVIDKISNIKMPDITPGFDVPGVPFLRAVARGGTSTAGGAIAGAYGDTYIFQGPVFDAQGLVQTLDQARARRGRRFSAAGS